ncbi:acetylxylan esterase [soil metagenome]
MPLTDLTLAELRDFRPEVAEPEDFDAFWAATLEESRPLGAAPVLAEARTPVTQLRVHDLTFPGFGGEPVRAWVTLPLTGGPFPTVVEYVGYGGGRGLPHERLHWAAAGYAHILMDTRGQGSGWGSGGDTPDPHGSGPAASGFMTRGIESPDDHYYRRVFTDAVRLVEAARGLPFVDAGRIAVTGGSQGGGIALAVAGLVPGLAAVLPDVPFLCHFRRSVELTPGDPFAEVARYLAVHRGAVDRVFETLSYFDGVNFARRATAPALFSVALMDPVVLPSTVFTAFNHYAGPAEIAVYEFNGHEGGAGHHWLAQAEFLDGGAGR